MDLRELSGPISRQTPRSFEGTVYRVTPVPTDATKPTANGGRWAPRPRREPGFRVLYTSLDRNGAIAEVASFLLDQSPRPVLDLKVSSIRISASKSIELTIEQLVQLGVDEAQFGQREYTRTQQIGAAINHLGFNGLISPSARWDCKNFTLFAQNHALDERLELLAAESINLNEWAEEHGL